LPQLDLVNPKETPKKFVSGKGETTIEKRQEHDSKTGWGDWGVKPHLEG
jgi:hypothetical protein